MINGVIFQRKHNGIYQGIEGDNWYLDNKLLSGYEEYFDDNIDVSCSDDDFVDVCNDEDYMKKYIEVSKKNDVEFQILLCETSLRRPAYERGRFINKEFLGFDYAYQGGSYYSAVNNDLVLRSFKEFEELSLNQNGLFETEEELNKFIKIREELAHRNEFEKGDFIKYKLYRCQLN